MREAEAIEHLEEALDRADEILLAWDRINELLQLGPGARGDLEQALHRANHLLVEWSRFGHAVRVQIELDRYTRLGSEVFDA